MRCSKLDLGSAGEFFVMAASAHGNQEPAATPQGRGRAIDPNPTTEEVDPRWELVHQLIQYKKFKEAAATLDRTLRACARPAWTAMCDARSTDVACDLRTASARRRLRSDEPRC